MTKLWNIRVQLDILTLQQANALTTIMPVANNQFTSNDSSVCAYPLLSDAVQEYFSPFSAVNHFAENRTCYGISSNSSTTSSFYRTRQNKRNEQATGFTSEHQVRANLYFTKAELVDVIFKHPDDEIIVIDPENEYAPRFGKPSAVRAFEDMLPNSPTHFNVFDTDLSYSDEGAIAYRYEIQFVMSVCETAKGMGLTFQ